MTDSQRETPERVLVIVAHPDDAEFGAAGTVAKLAEAGADVGYLLATNGDKGTSDPNITPARLAEIRKEEQKNACAALGARVFRFLDHPDGGVEDAEPLREQLVRAIREFRPDTVITFEPYRRTHTHRDHRNVGQAALDAVYPFARDHLSYPEHAAEGIEPWKVREVLLFASDFPDYWVDIEATISKKLEALKQHKSQVGERAEDALRESIYKRAQASAEGRPMTLAESFRRMELGR
jgi:LmbE family N-acetylglucosaminyl deacetylase